MINKSKRIVLKKNEARKVPFNFLTGEQSLEIILSQPGASITVFGTGKLVKNQKCIMDIKVIHQAPQTFSRLNFTGVLSDNAEVDLNGLIRIEKGAKGADGFFKADFLIFDEAKAKPKPFLEILDNDVKVGHAATVSKVDLEQLFYLMSRGLTKRGATEIIINGFLNKF